MEVKKNKKYDLERRRPAFFGLGLIITLAMVLTAFEWRTEIEPIIGSEPVIVPFTVIDIPITEIKEPPKPKVEKKVVQRIDAHRELEKTAKEIEPIVDSTPESPEIGEVPIVSDLPDEMPDEVPFERVEEMPSYKGGFEALYKFLGKNINYPRQAKNIGVEGRVFVRFVVEKDGSLSNIEVVKGIGAGCDEETIRVIKMVENFNPGKQRGVPVRVRMIVPINFNLQ